MAGGQIQSGSPDAAARFAQARDYLANGDLNNARQEAEALHTQNPRDVGAAILLANCYIRLGRAAEAVDLLKPLEPGNEKNQDLEYLLAFAMLQSTGSPESVTRMEAVARTARFAKAWAAAGAARISREQFPEAKVDLEQAMALDPSIPGLNTMLGKTLFAMFEVDDSLRYFRAALRANPRDFEANLYLGLYHMKRGEYEEARPSLEFALQLEPNSPLARLKTAQLNGMTGKYADAIATLEGLEKETPDWLEPHLQLSSIYYKVHRAADGEREREIVRRLEDAQQKGRPE